MSSRICPRDVAICAAAWEGAAAARVGSVEDSEKKLAFVLVDLASGDTYVFQGLITHFGKPIEVFSSLEVRCDASNEPPDGVDTTALKSCFVFLYLAVHFLFLLSL